MALFAYLQQTQRHLRDAKQVAFSPGDLIDYVNQARLQVAGDGKCIRSYATLLTVISVNSFNFSAINTGTPATNGIQGPLNVRSISVGVTDGKAALNNWPWPYFNQYYLNQVATPNGQPSEWAQFGQGVNGSIFLYPTPSLVFTLSIDAVCYPIALETDTTVEALPYPWTHAVSYFAAYLALLSPTSKKDGSADAMLALYEKFMERARRYATSDTLPYQFEQSGIKMPVVPAGVEIPSTGRGG